MKYYKSNFPYWDVLNVISKTFKINKTYYYEAFSYIFYSNQHIEQITEEEFFKAKKLLNIL